MTAIFIVNGLVSLLAAAYCHRKGMPPQHALTAFLICLCLPGGGLLLSWLLYRARIQPHPLETMFRLELEESEESRVDWHVPVAPTSEDVNTVPLEETFLIADYSLRRETILEILKRDVSNYAGLIRLALSNDDSETAHYAASGFMNIKRKLDNSLKRISDLYAMNPDDPGIARDYIDVLDQYLSSGGLDDTTRDAFLRTYSCVLEESVDLHGDRSILTLKRLTECLLELGDHAKVERVFGIIERECTPSEEMYLTLLDGYYRLMDQKNFHRVLSEFRASDIRFSKNTYNIVRFWTGDAV